MISYRDPLMTGHTTVGNKFLLPLAQPGQHPGWRRRSLLLRNHELLVLLPGPWLRAGMGALFELA